MVRLRNDSSQPRSMSSGIPDEDFIRGKTPMTKREIRIQSLAELRLSHDSVVWDVGAGTGSVSVECALLCPNGEIYAVEREADALLLTKRNVERFGVLNVQTVAGNASDALRGLPAPTHVFLGGSGGELSSILAHIEGLTPPIRFCAAAVTLESAYTIIDRLNNHKGWRNTRASQVAVSRLEPVGSYHMFKASNPVFIISADWVRET